RIRRSARSPFGSWSRRPIHLFKACECGDDCEMPIDPTKLKLPTQKEALPGRSERTPVAAKHLVTGAPMEPPFPPGMELAMFGMGCFWYAEHRFWQIKGVYTTASGYAGGYTPNP